MVLPFIPPTSILDLHSSHGCDGCESLVRIGITLAIRRSFLKVSKRQGIYCDYAWIFSPLHLLAVNLFLVSYYGFSSFITRSRIWYVFAYVSFRWSLQLRHNVSTTSPDPRSIIFLHTVHHTPMCIHLDGIPSLSFEQSCLPSLSWNLDGIPSCSSKKKNKRRGVPLQNLTVILYYSVLGECLSQGEGGR